MRAGSVWRGHPKAGIDVALLKLPHFTDAIDAGFLETWRFINFNNIVVGENVYFFGFPFGLTGTTAKEDFPILRAGIVSYKSPDTTRIAGIKIDPDILLIDGFSFGGNSGSRILTKLKKEKAKIVGIIKGHVPLINQRVIEKTSFLIQPSRDTVFLHTIPDTISFEQNTGLAIVVCADRIRETLELFRANDTL